MLLQRPLLGKELPTRCTLERFLLEVNFDKIRKKIKQLLSRNFTLGILLSSSKNRKKNFDSYCFVTSL